MEHFFSQIAEAFSSCYTRPRNHQAMQTASPIVRHTPLQQAIQLGDVAAVQALAPQVDVNEYIHESYYPQSFVYRGIDGQTINNFENTRQECTALHVAIILGKENPSAAEPIIKILMQYGANAHSNSHYPILNSSDPIYAPMFVSIKATHQVSPPFLFAIFHNSVIAVQVMLETDRSLSSIAALKIAVKKRHTEIIKLLIKNLPHKNQHLIPISPADMQYIYQTLLYAYSHGNLNVVQYFLENYAIDRAHKYEYLWKIVSRSNRNGLHIAAECEHVDSVQIINTLVQHGFDINAADAGSYTPLHAAIDRGQHQNFPALIFHGANLTAKNGLRRTPYQKCHLEGQEMVAHFVTACAGAFFTKFNGIFFCYRITKELYVKLLELLIDTADLELNDKILQEINHKFSGFGKAQGLNDRARRTRSSPTLKN